MASKKILSQRQFEKMMSLITTLADRPTPEMKCDFIEFDIDSGVDLDIDIDIDIDIDELYPPLPLVSEKLSAIDIPTPTLCGTKPICIRVPARVIHAFKMQAAKTGANYQTIMNRVLNNAVAGFV